MKILLIFFTTLFFVPLIQAHTSLVGVWQTDCNNFTKHSFKTTLTLTESKAIFITQFYADNKCAKNSITITYDGLFTVGSNFGEGIEINHIPSSLKFTLRLPEVVDQYNKSAQDGCGITDWKINIPQEVSGKYCRPNQHPATNQMFYDIYNVNGNELRFGGIPLHMDMIQPGLRPQKLQDIIFTRIDGINL